MDSNLSIDLLTRLSAFVILFGEKGISAYVGFLRENSNKMISL
jgi:hypothetical protein